MFRRLLLAALGASTFALAGCPMPPSSAARVREAATDLNTNTRFGRMESARDQSAVAPSEREDFVAHRRAWGKSAPGLADYEMVGAHMAKDENDAEVSVRYSWVPPGRGRSPPPRSCASAGTTTKATGCSSGKRASRETSASSESLCPPTRRPPLARTYSFRRSAWEATERPEGGLDRLKTNED